MEALSHLEITNGVFVHGMPSMKLTKKSSLLKKQTKMKLLRKTEEKRVNAFMDGDEDAIDYNDDDPEDEEVYEADPALSYDEENPDDEKSEVEAYDAEITKSYQMIWVKKLN